jgi:outer membrane protein OmpA-like peptidoglycan-associated protein
MSYHRSRAFAGALLLLTVAGPMGCATKGFVRNEVTGLRNRVDQVSTSADQANDLARTGDQHAGQAMAQARMAQEIALGNVKREEIRTATLHFDFDSAKLKDEGHADLDAVVEDLKSNPNYMALISGYTDATGDDEYNVGLAQRRAAAVNHYLAANLGNDFVRVAYIGLGEIKPIGDNATRDGRSQNRRVDGTLVRPLPATDSASTPPTASR